MTSLTNGIMKQYLIVWGVEMNWIRCKIEDLMKAHIRAGNKPWNEEERLERAYACGVSDEKLRSSQKFPKLDEGDTF